MVDTVNLDKINKLPRDCRFFDVNEWWYFPNRWVVARLYPLAVSPNHITVLSLAAGLLAAGCFLVPGAAGLLPGAVFLYLKLFFDNVDGPLARLRGEVSRLGRFLDSFTDFVVAVLVYAAITWRLAVHSPHPAFIGALGILAALSALLQCSYWVFYYVSYTRLVDCYDHNRRDETVSAQDRRALEAGDLPRLVYFLQRFHAFAYGWQDRAMAMLDAFSRKLAGVGDSAAEKRWYGDTLFLAWMGPLCICTNTLLLVVGALFNRLDWCLYLVVFGGNAYLVGLQAWKILRFRNGGAA